MCVIVFATPARSDLHGLRPNIPDVPSRAGGPSPRPVRRMLYVCPGCGRLAKCSRGLGWESAEVEKGGEGSDLAGPVLRAQLVALVKGIENSLHN